MNQFQPQFKHKTSNLSLQPLTYMLLTILKSTIIVHSTQMNLCT
jgi:hypothetical protein